MKLLLIVSDNVSYYWYPPKFTGEVLHLSNLKALDLSGNLDLESFLRELSKITLNSEFEYFQELYLFKQRNIW